MFKQTFLDKDQDTGEKLRFKHSHFVTLHLSTLIDT